MRMRHGTKVWLLSPTDHYRLTQSYCPTLTRPGIKLAARNAQALGDAGFRLLFPFDGPWHGACAYTEVFSVRGAGTEEVTKKDACLEGIGIEE